ncbi:methyl-accepting chemotaxis protein [Spirochaetota bacterium]
MFKWLINMKLRSKFLLFTISVLIISLLVIVLVMQYETSEHSKLDLKDYRKEEIKQVKQTLKNYIDIVISSIIKEKKELYRKGKISLGKAKRQCVREIQKLRYDDGTGYVWINDMRLPYPKMIMHPTVPSLDGKILKDPRFNCAYGRKKNLFQAAVEVCKKRGQGFVDYMWPKPTREGLTEEQPKISFVKSVDEWGWVLGTGVYVNDIDDRIKLKDKADKSQMRRILIFIIAISIIVALIMIIMIYIYSGFILKPLVKMRKVVDNVSNKDLTKQIDVDTLDEFGEMSGHFNTLILNFRELLKSTQHSGAILLDSIQELSTSSQEISTTSNEQAASVKEIVSTMEDSDELAKSIETRVDEVATISNKTKDSVINGFTIIKDSLNKMNEIKVSNTETIYEIKSLGDEIESIWDIVNIINNIADQTKIIAFNAELEASAAGEAGKNFQIVASEIRRLADNTMTSTNEVKNKIKEIQHSSDKLVLSSEEGTEKIKEGWELSNSIEKIFEEILSSSEITATSAEQIALSIKQQVSAFEQILQTLKQISEGIDNFVVSTKSTTNASISLKEMADSLNSTVDEYVVDVKKIEYNRSDID